MDGNGRCRHQGVRKAQLPRFLECAVVRLLRAGDVRLTGSMSLADNDLNMFTIDA